MRTVLFDLSVLTTETRQRGIGRYTLDLAPELANISGVRVRFLESISWRGRGRISDDPVASITRLTAPDRPFVSRLGWLNRLRLWLGNVRRQAGADFVHLPHSYATPLGRCPRIITCHDLIPLKYPRHYVSWVDGFRWGRRHRDRRRFSSADQVIAISQTAANDLDSLLGISDETVSVIHNGIDLAKWRPDEHVDDIAELNAVGLRPDGFLLFSGDTDWRKNHAGMFAALRRLRDQGSDLLLVCTGGLDHSRRFAMVAKAAQAGVSDAVIFTGQVSDSTLFALYRQALAVIFVSFEEGFGRPLVEAFACGTPVITSNLSSMAEIASDAAILVSPTDTDEIAGAIKSLVQDPELRLDLQRRGRERVAHFTLEQQRLAIEQAYLSFPLS